MKTTKNSMYLSMALKTIVDAVGDLPVKHVVLTVTTTTEQEIHVDFAAPVVTGSFLDIQPLKKHGK